MQCAQLDGLKFVQKNFLMQTRGVLFTLYHLLRGILCRR